MGKSAHLWPASLSNRDFHSKSSKKIEATPRFWHFFHTGIPYQKAPFSQILLVQNIWWYGNSLAKITRGWDRLSLHILSIFSHLLSLRPSRKRTCNFFCRKSTIFGPKNPPFDPPKRSKNFHKRYSFRSHTKLHAKS